MIEALARRLHRAALNKTAVPPICLILQKNGGGHNNNPTAALFKEALCDRLAKTSITASKMRTVWNVMVQAVRFV